MTVFRIFSMPAILGHFRGGYYGIKVIPKKSKYGRIDGSKLSG
jgi:hypothetical protein